MRLASSIYPLILCGWLTFGARAMPTCGQAFSGTVSRNLLSGAPGVADETASRENGVEVGKQVDETERALDAMKLPNADEQKTAAQIRIFIAHAREALEYDDVDGAYVLSAKARTLLLELCKDCRRHPGQKAKLRPIVGG